MAKGKSANQTKMSPPPRPDSFVTKNIKLTLVVAIAAVLFGGWNHPYFNKGSENNELRLKWLTIKHGQTTTIPIEGEESIRATGLGNGVFYLKNLIKKNEISGIISRTKDHLKTSKLNGGEDKENNGWRSSTMVTTSAENGPKKLNERIRTITGLSKNLVKNSTIQIQRYLPEDHYFPHYDSKQIALLGRPNKNFAYPYVGRFLTVVIYLTDSVGGHTVFPYTNMNGSSAWSYACLTRPSEKIAKTPKLTKYWSEYCKHLSDGNPTVGIAVQPVAGDAVLFYNHFETATGLLGELNPNSFHGGCTVPQGSEKYMMNYWLNIHPHMFTDLPADEKLPTLKEQFEPTSEEWDVLHGLMTQ
eukprot:TRINITY_DN10446_c0_g1_i1.p1 TRINITY_DN10446_c0_g1~~TRINITY_DN10446_c0_g1_i1.p1  ORF type:complete len:358 (+),score=40.56 TRINITY_DN10446_c0_g1_i1:50-1123(+)